MINSSSKILLFNPWIYDFAAYDFWIKPLGLLHLGGMLKYYDVETFLIDCLDRFHPQLLQYLGPGNAESRPNGTGRYYKEEIDKPEILRDIPRRYSRYGMPVPVVERLLGQVSFDPDFVFVTSIMSYWYPAVKDAVLLLRKYFKQAKIVLGGIYATLCSDHAAKVIRPDYLVAGAGEIGLTPLLNSGWPGPEPASDNGQPWYDCDYTLYPRLESAAVLTSRGCPFHCSFCASNRLSVGYSRRQPAEVVREIERLAGEHGVRHVTFYDDALLHRADDFIKPVLRQVIDHQLPVQFHTPNGLQIRYIDQEMADLFWEANVKTIRLSFESSSPSRQRLMDSKVNNEHLEIALSRLETAGFSRSDIAVYVLMGLPDQEIAEFKQSVKYVVDLGAKVSVASYSPIPGTRDWIKSIKSGAWNPDSDLLLTNNSIFPLWRQKYDYQTCRDLMLWAKTKNESLN